MKAKKICAGAMALVLSMGTMSAFTGCGSSTDSSSKAVTPEVSQADITDAFDAKGAKLEVLTNRTDRKEDGKLDALTDKFEKAYNCTVEYTAYKDYDTDVATRMGTDDYGDVLCIPSSLKLEELPTYFVSLGTYDEFKDTYRWSDKKMTADGNVYGLAVGGTATGVLYNKKIWEQAGITETPKTPDEFLADLQLIKDNTDAIPYYTNFKDASWTIGQWQNLVLSAAGGADAENKLLQDKGDLFTEGNGYYEVYKLMYDLFSKPDLLEEDHANTEWESSKVWFGEGKIATMVMGSWAVSQFMEKAENPDDIGYMPVPITAADGKVYAEEGPDYTLGVSANSKNQDLAKAYVEWFISDSGFSEQEGMISTVQNKELPSTLSGFKDAVFFEKAVAPDNLVGKFDEIDKESGVGVWQGDEDNFKIKLAEAAFAGKGDDGFNEIIADVNKKWAAARDKVLG